MQRLEFLWVSILGHKLQSINLDWRACVRRRPILYPLRSYEVIIVWSKVVKSYSCSSEVFVHHCPFMFIKNHPCSSEVTNVYQKLLAIMWSVRDQSESIQVDHKLSMFIKRYSGSSEVMNNHQKPPVLLCKITTHITIQIVVNDNVIRSAILNL